MSHQTLTQQQLKQLFHYNPSNGLFTRLTKVSNQHIGTEAGAVNKHSGHLIIKIKSKTYTGYALAWLYMHGELPPPLYFLNGIKHDCSLLNLTPIPHPVDQQRLKHMMYYDPITGHFTWRVSTRAAVNIGDRAGTVDNKGYVVITIDGSRYKAHRLAWLYTYGRWPNGDIDHYNRVKHHNWIRNLTDSPRQSDQNNSRNHPLWKNNTSGCVGVTWRNSTSKWVVNIGVNGKQKHIGYFTNKEEAIMARLRAEQELGYHPHHGR